MKNTISRQDMILATKRMNENFNEIWDTLIRITDTKTEGFEIANQIQEGLERIEKAIDNADWNILNNDKAVM